MTTPRTAADIQARVRQRQRYRYIYGRDMPRGDPPPSNFTTSFEDLPNELRHQIFSTVKSDREFVELTRYLRDEVIRLIQGHTAGERRPMWLTEGINRDIGELMRPVRSAWERQMLAEVCQSELETFLGKDPGGKREVTFAEFPTEIPEHLVATWPIWWNQLQRECDLQDYVKVSLGLAHLPWHLTVQQARDLQRAWLIPDRPSAGPPNCYVQ